MPSDDLCDLLKVNREIPEETHPLGHVMHSAHQLTLAGSIISKSIACYTEAIVWTIQLPEFTQRCVVNEIDSPLCSGTPPLGGLSMCVVV